MKYFILLFLVSAIGYGQIQFNNKQQEIFELELGVRKSNDEFLRKIIGDSLLIHINIVPYEISLTELKSTASISGELSKKEIEEIFGPDPDKNYTLPTHPKEWTLQDFSGRLVTFYKGDKEVLKRKILAFYNVLSISVPVIRNDSKYALIQTSNEHEGGVLHIYKNTPNGWVHYKNIQLYYI